MDALPDSWRTPTLPESSIALIGLTAAVVGLTLRDPVGITSVLAAGGICLMIAGTVYIAVDGPEPLRLSLAFVALVALPLFSYGGLMRWAGGLTVGVVVVGALYSRVER